MNQFPLIYILAGLLLFWIVAFASYYLLKKKQQKILSRLRENWGSPDTGYRNYDLVGNFSALVTTVPFHRLSGQTVADMDIYDLFAFIDRTTSKPGQQYLFDKILKPTDDINALREFDEQVAYFTRNKDKREEAQLLLTRLDHDDAYFIADLLSEKILERPKWVNLFKLDTALVIIMILFSFKFPVLLIWLMIPFALNLVLHYRNKSNTFKFLKSFPQLKRLLNVCGSLLKKNLPFEKTNAQKAIKNLQGFVRNFKLLNFGENSTNELAQVFLLFLELVKALFLVEVHGFFSTLKELKNKREDINTLICYAGSIDAAISTASLRAGLPGYTTPRFTDSQKALTVTKLYHPLVENCIANSLRISDKSILVTGSNMSGKSTFIRAVAINSILAQTIYTCFAEEFVSPVLKLYSSIRIADNVMAGKSYYFEEVNTIGNLLEASQQPFQHLFILDEVFKGTNTIERVSAAKAILSYLNKNKNLVLVSTHDIELADLLKNEFDLYHFTEDIENEELVFDHHLKTGPLKTRNAIKILSLAGYPAEIIQEANTIANKN